MSEAEAIAHIKAADADGNMAIDFAEFGKLWEALHGAEEVGKIESCQRTFAKLHSARRRPTNSCTIQLRIYKHTMHALCLLYTK